MAIYFIQHPGGDVKIGRSREPIRRLRDLRTITSAQLEFLRIIDGGCETETWLHRYFADQRVQGEWFKFDVRMLSVQPPEETSVESFATRLKRAREAKYASAAEFATVLEVGEHGYRNYERGRTEPNFDLLLHICWLLDVTPNDLLLRSPLWPASTPTPEPPTEQ